MDSVLCDELLIHIFQLLPPSSSPSISLVSKRWLRLRRLSTTSLSLSSPPPHPLSIPSFLSLHPFLSSLSLSSSPAAITSDDVPTFDDLLLSAAAASPPTLKHLRFLSAPTTPTTLLALPFYKSHLSSLSVSLSRPFNFSFLSHFPSLNEFSISVSSISTPHYVGVFSGSDQSEPSTALRLQSLSVAGIAAGDVGFGWLWRSCGDGGRLRRLQLRCCEGVGDGQGGFSSFSRCLQGLEQVEFRTCRSMVDGALLRMAENCRNLRSLLVYDGGSREGLLDFIVNCRCHLERIDLRLPLDLNNDHLSAMAAQFRGLKALNLQSCCLITGEGLKDFSSAMGNVLQEVALINCDVVEKVPGLLTTLGQNFKRLRRLDISYNKTLSDKEFISILASCHGLFSLNLGGCILLTPLAFLSVAKSCKFLEEINVMQCYGVNTLVVEVLVGESPRLRRMEVEQYKVSNAARALASVRGIEIVG